jgi:hypothetical protein
MLITRPDGTRIKGLSAVRRMMPYLMKGRGESVVFFEQVLDMTEAIAFIDEWNKTHERKLTPFHLVLSACGKALHARPGLNRFVSGGRIWQRKGCFVSFAAKKAFADDAPLVTVKMEVPRGDEPLPDTVHRIHASVGEGRSDKERTVDKEVKLATSLPGFLLALVLGFLRLLDRFNLLPGALIRNDPLYASLFVANLGSVGIDRVWHHLYEYGTVSLFCAIGELKPRVVPGPDGQPVVKPTLRLRYSFDERINDGFYCAASLGIVREYVENPRLFAERPVPPSERSARVTTSTL